MPENKNIYIKNPLNQQESRENRPTGYRTRLVPLSHTIIKHLFVLFAALIIGITLIINNYLSRKMEGQFHDQLQEYIIQRGKRESELFSLARDNLIRLKNEFSFQYQNDPRSDFTDWFNSHLTPQPDGTLRSSQKYFDGVWTPDGTYEHGMGMVVGPEVEITGEIKRRMGIAHGLILKYGPAWRSRFVNLWFVGPEKISLNYWPDIEPGSRISSDFGGQEREWFSDTQREKSPGQQILWTGFYFDSLSGQWMISAALPIEINGQKIGSIGTDIECGDFFNRNLSDSAVSSYSIILDQDGYIIVHPYKIAETISSRNPRFTVDLAKDANLSFLYKKIKSVSVFPAIIENNENDELIAVTKIEGPDWYLASVYYKALFKDQIMTDVLFTITLGLGSLIAALFIIYLVVKKNISQPLGVLTNSAENFNAFSREENNETHALQLESLETRSDEFGLLSRTFTQAGTRLRKVYQDLDNARLNLEAQVSERTWDLAQAKKAAETANRDKSRFLANMSHELRTPLNVILGFSHLMEQDVSLTPDQCENLRVIHESGDQLLSLINDVLDLSKIENQKIVFTPENFDLFHFLDNLAAMFQQGAGQKKLAFTLESGSDLPRYIQTDKIKLRQVMINLLGNAVKYTDKGTVSLTVSLVAPPFDRLPSDRTGIPVKTPGAWIRFQTRDTGIGIDPRDMDIIFNRFVRARYGPPGGTGTGLGLTISRHFVRVMGAELNAASEPGQGTAFFFDLPVGIVTSRDIKAPARRRMPLGLTPGQPPCSVLIAEDHEHSRMFLTKLLTRVGFKVHTVENGRAAVDTFFCLKPDLVLMDIRMPVMDGLAAAKKIKAGQNGQHTPIIAITAHAFEKEQIRILSAGFDDFIPKPLDEANLFECLYQHLGVAFTYTADLDRERLVPPLSSKGLDPDRVARLPDLLREELKSASAELNQEQTLACIEKIKKTDKPMAEHLALLANEFKFEEIWDSMQIPENKKA